MNDLSKTIEPVRKIDATRLVRPEGSAITSSPLRITPEVTCPA